MAIKLSNFIIAALFVTFFAVSITVFTASVYKQTGETGNETLDFLNKTKELTDLINETEQKSQDVQPGNALDLIGAYLVSAGDAVKISIKSGQVVSEMTREGFAELPVSSGVGTQLKVVATASLTVALIVGVLLAIYTKRDM